MPKAGRDNITQPCLRCDTSASTLPIVPPEWVALVDVPQWIARLYGVVGEVVVVAIVLGVRSGELRACHRIPDLEPRVVSRGGRALPPGLDHGLFRGGAGRNRHRVFAEDWEAAETEWKDCTVGGWAPDVTRERERLPIEVEWQGVERFVLPRLSEWPRSGAPVAAAPIQRRGGGRASRPDKTRFVQQAVARLTLDGNLLTLTELRRHMREWAVENMSDALDDTTVNRWLDELVQPGLLPK